MNPKALMQVFRANKFVLVAYTGLTTRLNTTRWYVCLAAPWARLRHHIESFGLEACEDEALERRELPLDGRPAPNTIIRGFTVHRVLRDYTSVGQWPQELKDLTDPTLVAQMPLPETELKGSEWAQPNTFLFVVRAALPWGARPYVPIEERSKYALLQERAQYDMEDPTLRAQIAAFKSHAEDAWHAADRPISVANLELTGNPVRLLGPNTGDPSTLVSIKTSSSAAYSVPPMDYLCANCREFGLHYAEACWLFTAERLATPPKVGLQFGAKKFGAAKAASADDATFYALLHKRSSARRAHAGYT